MEVDYEKIFKPYCIEGRNTDFALLMLVWLHCGPDSIGCGPVFRVICLFAGFCGGISGHLPFITLFYRLSQFTCFEVLTGFIFVSECYLFNLLNCITMLIVSKLTTYDHDDLLWYTKIGESKGEMSLFCIVAGKTVTESRSKAEKLLEILVKEQEK